MLIRRTAVYGMNKRRRKEMRRLWLGIEQIAVFRWLRGEISTRDLEWAIYTHVPDDSPYWSPHWSETQRPPNV